MAYTGYMSTRRPQNPKPKRHSIDAIGRAEVNRAGSNAAGPHKVKTTYTRKPKHRNREY